MPAWIPYTLLRLALFGVVFVLLLLAGIWPVVAAVFGVVVSFTVSYIFFPKLRDRVSIELAETRERRRQAADAADAARASDRGVDEDAEDGPSEGEGRA